MRKFVLLALLLASVAQAAVDWSAYKPAGYVSDFAQILEPMQLAKVEALVRQLNSRYGVEMVFVVVPSLAGEDSEEVATTLYHYWNIGQKTDDSSVLMLLSVNDSLSHLYIGDGLLDVLDEQWEENYASEVSAYLNQNSPRRALVAAVRSIATQVGDVLKAEGAMVASNTTDGRHKFGQSRRSFGAQSKNSAANMGGKLPMVAIVAALFGGFLIVSTMVRAGSYGNKTFYDYGHGFERGRTGPFGNKKPRWQARNK